MLPPKEISCCFSFFPPVFNLLFVLIKIIANPIKTKMIPEIKLLCENFSDIKWNKESQILFIVKLKDVGFFEGKGSDKYKDLDVEITPLNTVAVVDIKQRPSIFQSNTQPKNDFNLSDSKVFIRESLI